MCANMLQSWIFEKSALNYRRCCFVLFIRSALTKPHCNLVPHNCTIATQLDPLQSQPQQHYNSCTESCSSMIFLSSIGYQSALVSLVHSTVSYFTWRNHRLATFPLHFLSVQLLIVICDDLAMIFHRFWFWWQVLITIWGFAYCNAASLLLALIGLAFMLVVFVCRI